MNTRPVLFDYIRFTGAKPIETHDEGWYYGVRFAISCADDDLLITLAPGNMEFALEWKQKGQRRLSLNLKMVNGWEIENGVGGEYLSMRINTGPAALCSFDYCIIRLKPTIDVEMLMDWGPGWPPSCNSALHTDAPKAARPRAKQLASTGNNMPFTIVSVMPLAAEGVILCVANASLFALLRGAERSFPIDRDDTDEARIAKLGVDTMFGLLPVFLALILQVLSIDAPLQLSPSQQFGTIAGTFVYLLIYFAFIRRCYSAFRLKTRRMLVGASRNG